MNSYVVLQILHHFIRERNKISINFRPSSIGICLLNLSPNIFHSCKNLLAIASVFLEIFFQHQPICYVQETKLIFHSITNSFPAVCTRIPPVAVSAFILFNGKVIWNSITYTSVLGVNNSRQIYRMARVGALT